MGRWEASLGERSTIGYDRVSTSTNYLKVVGMSWMGLDGVGGVCG